MSAAWQNSPNLLTFARLGAVPVLLLMLARGEHDAAFYLFAAAAVSDALDGFLAKRFFGVSAVGAIMDPLADKLLVTGVLWTLALVGVLPAWLLALTLARDVLVVAGAVALRLRVPTFKVAPHPLGKACTFLQLCLVGAALASLSPLPALAGLVPPLTQLTALLTVASAAVYLVAGARLLLGDARAPGA